MGNLSHEQAVGVFNAVNGFVVVFAIIVTIVKIALVVLLFILLIKAIQYYHNKNRNLHDCSTCVYKQQYNQTRYKQFSPKDG